MPEHRVEPPYGGFSEQVEARSEATLVAAQRQAEIERSNAEKTAQWFAAIVDSSEDAITSATPDELFVSWNRGAEKLYGYSAQEAIGQPISLIIPRDERAPAAATLVARVFAGERIVAREVVSRRKDASLITVSLTKSELRDANGRVLGDCSICRDVTERKLYETQLLYDADHDALTGLLNRRAFALALDAQAAFVKRYGSVGAILILDLDYFKYVNDTHGHHAGDELIVGVSQRLSQRLRASDVLARLGGDEFGVLLPKADAQDARRVAEGLLEALRSQPVTVAGVESKVTASIGMATFGDQPGLAADQVLVNADLARYDAKEGGRDRLASFNLGPRPPRSQVSRRPASSEGACRRSVAASPWTTSAPGSGPSSS